MAAKKTKKVVKKSKKIVLKAMPPKGKHVCEFC